MTNYRKSSNSIKTLSSVLKCSSFSTFLLVGLNGCSSNSDCSNLNNLSQKKIDECKNEAMNNSYTSSYSSGFFSPISRSTGHSSSSSSRLGG